MRRAAGLFPLASRIALALLAGCAGAPPAPAPRDSLPQELRPFLIDPTDPADPRAEAGEIHRLFLRLLGGGDAAEVERAARALLARSAELTPAQVLLAQVRLVAGDAPGAVEAARRSGEAGGLPARLVEARALEASGDLPAALFVYRDLAGRSQPAAQQAATLEPRVAEILRRRIADALDRAQPVVAQRELERLEALRPHEEDTLRLALRVAAARGDRVRELALARSLMPAAAGDRELALRRAQLEMEVGDARTGLDLFQTLADAAPGDARLAEELRRARFLWRVLNAPESVRRAAARPQVTRADLAVLLYWLVPQVRTARGGSGRIASDVLDHPAQEAIVRVVNLGLLGVDETLHRFDPDRAARRAELFRALLRLLGEANASGCAALPPAPGDAAADPVCRGAAACGLAPSEADCLPTAPLSGAEALEALRRALVLLERP